MLLVVIADFNVASGYNFTPVGLQLTVNYFKKGSFSGSVITDNGNVFSFFQEKAQITEKLAAGEGFGKLLYLQHILAAGQIGNKRKLHTAVSFNRLFQHLYFLKRLFPALGPFDGFFPIKGFQLFNHCLLMADFLLLFQIGIQPSRSKDFLFGRIGGIVTCKNGAAALIQFNYLSGNFIQKIPVVGNHQDGSLIVEKVVFQPGDGVHVKVIGGLIQNDQIRLCQEKTAQCNPGLLSAGQS